MTSCFICSSSKKSLVCCVCLELYFPIKELTYECLNCNEGTTCRNCLPNIKIGNYFVRCPVCRRVGGMRFTDTIYYAILQELKEKN